MNTRKSYIKPIIEEHTIDNLVCLGFQSEGPITPPGSPAPQQSQPMLKSAPSYQDMPSQTDAFGTTTPDYNYTNE